MIEVDKISKTFRIPMRKAGIKEAVRAFFVREYKEIKALDDVSFKIDEGEIVGYIGPNGAGKSSTIKIMSGILRPDAGKCSINGIDPSAKRREHAQQIGVVFGQRSQLWWDIPVIDSFELLRDMYQIPQADYRERLQALITLLKLGEIIQMPTRQLSLGQRMRCEIVASLLHNPKVLFLDEPTIGLDAESKLSVRSFIREINRRYNTTVVLTTHDMQDIESLATRIILIGRGRILFDGSVDALKQRYQVKKMIKVKFRSGTLNPSSLYEIISIDNGLASVRVLGSISCVLDALTKQLEVEDIEMQEESIDDIILNMYRTLQI
ncbi:ATP-binding cassette domain-containing protein [Erysipelothrix sp. HDW6C]|uniref:ABC transporter ATP-binding protein n=1 Tax=Erysipelothrix sp. HDW6C TaxID=2714930 RepID=UPI00140E85FA|nr:ATP-binding cassette domain-containing protein [Erysipelothrix sp. HDW6C]QIK69581.1 ATP-binding cassette domain-containing protein [Erysipelothrix sp. HDW6C]